MIIRTTVTGIALAGAASLPLAGIAVGQGDRDCRDFGSQSEAQNSLRPGDPERLDANKNGIACENLPASGPESQGVGPEVPPKPGVQTPSGSTASEGSSDNAAPPVGGVETGYGGAAQQDETALPLTLAGAATAIAAGGVAILSYRRAHRH